MDLFKGNFWVLISIAVLAVCVMVGLAIANRMLKRYTKNHLWTEALLQAAYLPLQIYIGFSAAYFLIKKIPYIQDIEVFSLNSGDLRHMFSVLIFVWLGFRFISRFELAALHNQSLLKKLQRDKITTIRVLAKSGRVLITAFLGISILQLLGIPMSALLTFGGIGSVMLGFAAKDSLSNFLGGLMVYVDRPFMVGDWICSPDRNIEGTVENIGWRLTTIRTFEKRLLYVPNGTFSNISIQNASRMSNRRIKTTIGVRYSDAQKMEQILVTIKTMLQEHPEIEQKKTMLVNLVGFGESSLNILVYAYTKTTVWENFQNVQQDVFLKILAIISDCGAECAFPTRTVHVTSDVSEPSLV